MKVKIKTNDKKRVRQWLKKSGAAAHLGDMIAKELDDNNFDHIDWLQQVLEEKKVSKDVFTWLFNQKDPVDTVVQALAERYVVANRTESTSKDVAEALKTVPTALQSVSILEINSHTRAFVVYVSK